jgi:IS30 family transposase
LKSANICAYVEEKLTFGWSSEQIAGRISLDHPEFSINHEAIYQYIYEEHPECIQYVPRSHEKRQKRCHSRKHRTSHIPNRIAIDTRPQHIDDRSQTGHWVSDTLVSRQSKAALLVSVERKTRFSFIGKLDQKTAESNKACLLDQLLPMPSHLTRSITYDNGSENTEHEMVNHALGTSSYFCNPYHSWEKGTGENTIGLIRRYFPKKTNFSHVDPTDLMHIELLLNNRPRKCLNYNTPLEAITKECCT